MQTYCSKVKVCVATPHKGRKGHPHTRKKNTVGHGTPPPLLVWVTSTRGTVVASLQVFVANGTSGANVLRCKTHARVWGNVRRLPFPVQSQGLHHLQRHRTRHECVFVSPYIYMGFVHGAILR